MAGWSARRFPSQKSFVFFKPLVLLKMLSPILLARGSTLRIEVANHSTPARGPQRTPAMAAGLTDHIWTAKELLHFVLVPLTTNT
jgi:hypothetical protein